MIFEIGDNVAVIDDIVEGIVTKITKQHIFIVDHHDMEFSFLPSELVKIEEDLQELSKYAAKNHKMFLEKKMQHTRKKSAFKKVKNEIVFEVDLHINQLVSSTQGMDNYDMLNLQIDTAKRKLEYAINKRISKVVFIHGVGEGVLKTELSHLFKKYPVKYYDASYQKYGLGATEVYIFQNPN